MSSRATRERGEQALRAIEVIFPRLRQMRHARTAVAGTKERSTGEGADKAETCLPNPHSAATIQTVPSKCLTENGEVEVSNMLRS